MRLTVSYCETPTGSIPSDLRLWLETPWLIRLALNAARTCPLPAEVRNLDFSYAGTFDSPTLLSLLLYAYSCGILPSEEVERQMHIEPGLIYLRATTTPDWHVLRRFRRLARTIVQCRLSQVLENAWHLHSPASVISRRASLSGNSSSIRNICREEAERRVNDAVAQDCAALDF